MRGRPVRGCLWFVLIGSVVVVIAGAFIFVRLSYRFSQYGPVARTLPDELRMAKEMGLPLSPDDLRPNPPIPDSQNAAPLYVQIDRKFKSLPPAEQKEDGNVMDLARKPKSPAEIARARTILARRVPELILAEEASRLPHFDFHRRWELGPSLLLPEYATTRQLARLFAARATLLSRDGHPIDALRDVATGARIGRHMAEDPCMIAMLVEIAVRAIVDRTFDEIVVTHGSEDGVLEAAVRTNFAFSPPPSIEKGLWGEVILGEVILQMLRRDPTLDRSLASSSESDMVDALRRLNALPQGNRRQMCDAWEARALSYWRQAIVAVRSGKGDLMNNYREIKRLGDEQEVKIGKPTYELNAILMPVFSQAALKVAHCEELARLRATLIALVDHKKQTGGYPTSLNDLPISPPPDIFTGKPPIYRKTTNGFILYSVGDNFRDDGGKAKADNKGEHPPDIVVQDPIQ